MPRTSYTVEYNVNDKLYFRLTQPGSTYYDHIITLDTKDYNGAQFAAECQSKITAITGGAVTFCVYDPQTRKMSVSVNNHDINIFTDAELVTSNSLWGGMPFDINQLNSGNELLTNVFSNVVGNTNNPAKYYLNLTPVRNIYIRSPNLSSFNTIGCNGESSIIKKCQSMPHQVR